MVALATERPTTKGAEVAPDSSGFVGSSFTAPSSRSDFQREARGGLASSQRFDLPPQVSQAVKEETALFIDRCNGTGESTTPISPRVREFVQENPLAAHHFVDPKGRSNGVAYAGKLEHERAKLVLEKLNQSAERMLDFHGGRVEYNSKEFIAERKLSLRLASEYAALTGERPREVAHTNFTNAENRQKWAAEFERLQGSLDQAAIRAQDKQLAFIKKHNLGEDVTWIEGVKLDKGAYSRFTGVVEGQSAEGKQHPIVQRVRDERIQAHEQFQQEQAQRRAVDRAKSEINMADWAKADPARFQHERRIQLRDSRATNQALVESAERKEALRRSEAPVATVPTPERSRPAVVEQGDLAKQLVAAAKAEARIGDDPRKEREFGLITADLIAGATPTERGNASRELAVARRSATGADAEVYDRALSLLRRTAGSPDEAEKALPREENLPGLRKFSQEELQKKAKENIAALTEAIVAGKDTVPLRVAENASTSRLTPLERKEFAQALDAALKESPISAAVQKRVREDAFSKPLAGGEPSPKELSTLAKSQIDQFIQQTLPSLGVVNAEGERKMTTAELTAKAQENAQKLVAAASTGRTAMTTALLETQSFGSDLRPVERKEYVTALKTIFATMDFEGSVASKVGDRALIAPLADGRGTLARQAAVAQQVTEKRVTELLDETKTATAALNPDSLAAELWNSAYASRDLSPTARGEGISAILEKQYTRTGLNTAKKVQELRIGLEESVGNQMAAADPATRAAYEQLVQKLADHGKSLQGDAEAVTTLKNTMETMIRERREGRTMSGDLVTRAFGSTIPTNEELRRYSARLGWRAEDDETKTVSEGQRKFIAAIRRELALSELKELAGK